MTFINPLFTKKMIRINQLAIFAVVSILSTASVVAQETKPATNKVTLQSNSVESLIRKTIEAKIGNGAKIDEIRVSPLAGLYEVRLGNDIIYVDKTAEFLIAGSIQNLKTGKNYTQERVDTLASAAVFSAENKPNALKLVKGDGSRELVLFEDPNCGYCKKIRSELENINNITVYTYLVPILSQDSADKMRAVWCSKDRNKAYEDWMLKGINPVAVKKNCSVPIEQNQMLANSVRVQGTPALFFKQGKRVPGFIKAEQIEQLLTQSVQK